jgi:hypothetical protein
MKKLLPLLVASCISLSCFADFGIYATAVYINIDGTTAFHNCMAPGNGQNIGAISFQGVNLGSFYQNDGKLILAGAEIKSFKGPSDNVCSGSMYFTVYLKNQRPQNPVFQPIGLGFFSDCTDPVCGSFPNAFPQAKGGGCCNPGDQKWQFPGGGNGGGANGNIDLTSNLPGEYVLEVYFQSSGQDNGNGCGSTKYDSQNNNPTNYSASFSIIPVLPVKFGSISVSALPSGNEISWTTLSEENALQYLVERSTTGTQFTSIGQRPAAGNSSSARQYSFTDPNPSAGNNYYRIRLEEKTGREAFSPIVIANAKLKAGKAMLYPNPAREVLHLYIPSGKGQIIMYESTGKRLHQYPVTGQHMTLPCSQLAPGNYFAAIVSNDEKSVIPFVISR